MTIFIMVMSKRAKKKNVIRAAKAPMWMICQKITRGYQTILNEEASNISQGQRQLITIARAFLANPDVFNFG